jgi:hypothetical protein
MRARRVRGLFVVGAVPLVVTLALSAGTAAAARSGGTVRPTAVATAGAAHGYIIVLRRQNRGLAARSPGRLAAVRSEQAPVLAQLRSLGVRPAGSTSLLNAVFARMSAAQAQQVAANAAVAEIVPDGVIAGPAPATEPAGVSAAPKAGPPARPSRLCGSAAHPQLDPQALYNIKALGAHRMGFDGAGVTVAYLADGINPADPDLQRSPRFASAGSPAGSPVVTQENFAGDATSAVTTGGEAFLDAGSIAAQGNDTYDLSRFVSPAHPLPARCDIRIEGVAPGASVLGLKVFALDDDSTVSGFLQAINYAVAHGVKVINESFGLPIFPDTTADTIRQADDAVVAAGVTVVVSSGDAGAASTLGSPATDPSVISVGATTTFRAYAQGTEGGINDPHASGRWVDNNISSLSSGGFSQAGGTVDLVAPGDMNWALCDPNSGRYIDCTSERGAGSPIQLASGTSESAPLTAGAAADVIQAYASAHGGADPSPSLVKRILMSTATDIDAPATEQGAGLLNVTAAVREALSVGKPRRAGGLLVSPGQVNVSQEPGATARRVISVTNTSSHRVSVTLSTRALTGQARHQAGSFCMQPGAPTAACPANTGVFADGSGIEDVYQDESFTVPATSGPSRLVFTAGYQFTGQTSVLNFALIEPDGAYAGYSQPNGLGDFGDVEVADPPAGKWTAVFFTEQDNAPPPAPPGGTGTSGPVLWAARTLTYAPAGTVRPSVLSLGPGQTSAAHLSVTSPRAAGDSAQSVVLSSRREQTTVPVTIRTIIATGPRGGTFSGVLTGGNGRGGSPAQSNTYIFDVPPGRADLDASVALANDPGDQVTGFLVAPDGQTLGYSTNVTTDADRNPIGTRFVSLYHARPQPGRWSLVLDWANPVSGLELREPFTGAIGFSRADVRSDLPRSATLSGGQPYTFTVHVHNTGRSPEAFFVDPRLHVPQALSLPDLNGSDASMTLPLPAGLTFPQYFVPAQTSQLQARLAGTVPVNFDMEYSPGDPDLPGVTSGDSASLTLSEPEVSPGVWSVNPDEIGPYPASGAPTATASGSLTAITRAFDPAVTSSTGDLWSSLNRLTRTFTPVYVPAGHSAVITVQITPTAAAGSHVSGTLFVDDVTLGGFIGAAMPDGDELAAIPYSYRVS